VGFHTFVDLSQQFFGATMAMLKEVFEHPLHREAIRKVSEGIKGKFVFNGVDEKRAVFAGLLRLPSLDTMALPPVSERPLNLTVTEPLVPVEVFD